jgi:hypothetical protein
MREPADSKPERVNVQEELSVCPKCGGGGGFHVSFRKLAGGFEVVLVCPSCRFRFTVGEFLIPDGEPRAYDPTIDDGP